MILTITGQVQYLNLIHTVFRKQNKTFLFNLIHTCSYVGSKSLVNLESLNICLAILARMKANSGTHEKYNDSICNFDWVIALTKIIFFFKIRFLHNEKSRLFLYMSNVCLRLGELW